VALHTIDFAQFLTASLDRSETYKDVTSHIQRFGSHGNALTCAQKVPSSNAGQRTSSSTEHIVIPLRKYLGIMFFFKLIARTVNKILVAVEWGISRRHNFISPNNKKRVNYFFC
jgi:hypothetical protein